MSLGSSAALKRLFLAPTFEAVSRRRDGNGEVVDG